MQKKAYPHMWLTLWSVAIILLLGMTAAAQEMRSEVSVEGTGFFTKNSDGNRTTDKPTNSGGILVGYRHHLFGRFSAEANYGYARNSQVFSGNTAARVQSNVHQVTGAAVVGLPQLYKFKPFAIAGGGALVFDPTYNAGGTVAGASRQTRGTFVYGGGADYPITTHVALRAEYRGFVYKTPSFDVASLNTDSWTHTAQPSAGIVLKF